MPHTVLLDKVWKEREKKKKTGDAKSSFHVEKENVWSNTSGEFKLTLHKSLFFSSVKLCTHI